MKSLTFQTADAQQTAWSSHLQTLLDDLDIPRGTLANHLIESVAMYCRKHHPQGLQSADLKLLIARAFCAVGDRAAADEVLQSMESHRRHSSRWLEILTELHGFPELLPFFSAGIIRPADWAGAQMDRMWILDFDRLTLSDSEKHEMMLYRSIRAILDKIYIFWDVTGGEGILGLKNLSALNVEGKGEKGDSMTSSKGLLEYIADLFAQQKDVRKWFAIPSLLNLDF
jgi:hypothetical protein